MREVGWGEVCPECNCLILTSGHHADSCSRNQGDVVTEPLTRDSFDDYIAKQMEDPKFMEEYLASRKVMDRCYHVLCPWQRCEISIDPVTNVIVTAIGPVGCGCDNRPGWRSKYYEGLPKPSWMAKPQGRHGGRIAAGRRREAEHEKFLDHLVEMFTKEA